MIAYKEKYDFSFAYLEFPHSPFTLAVFESEGNVIARPIIDLDNHKHSPFFTYKGQVYETNHFESRDDSLEPECITEWVQSYLRGNSMPIDLTMTEKERQLFKVMLEQKKYNQQGQIEEINEWL